MEDADSFLFLFSSKRLKLRSGLERRREQKLTWTFCPQETAARLPVQDPDEPQHVAAVPQHGVPAGRLAGQHGGQRRPVHVGRRPPALLPADLLHLDGAGVRPHVHRPGQGLQHLHPPIHPEVLRRGMG